MTVFDMVLPMMQSAVKMHLRRGRKGAERLYWAAVMNGYKDGETNE
jgi:hypothetical protein